MKQYEIECPYCGAINKVYLEETEGWMECDHCLQNVSAHLLPSEKYILLFGARLS